MTKRYVRFLVFLFLPMMLSGCSTVGSKSASLSIIYGAAAVISLLLLVGYCLFVRKRDVWLLLLFASVLIVNIGYLSLSISHSLGEALLANRISYLGSVFLPMSMLMSILDVTKIRYQKWVPVLLLSLGVAVFLIAASPGYLTIYYQEVSLETVNGITVLNKVYGPWHRIYLFYLLGYFLAMVATIRYASVKKKIDSPAHAAFLAVAVLVNIGVWLIEQLVKIDFEFLSVSYIISELFLLSVYLVMQDQERLRELAQESAATGSVEPETIVLDDPDEREEEAAGGDPSETRGSVLSDRCEQFLSGLTQLTQTERTIYEGYLAEKTTREIMSELGIKENTLKYHNKNLYGKLGVSSRKQLMEVYRRIAAAKANRTEGSDVDFQ